jgi:hypothetical protein
MDYDDVAELKRLVDQEFAARTTREVQKVQVAAERSHVAELTSQASENVLQTRISDLLGDMQNSRVKNLLFKICGSRELPHSIGKWSAGPENTDATVGDLLKYKFARVGAGKTQGDWIVVNKETNTWARVRGMQDKTYEDIQENLAKLGVQMEFEEYDSDESFKQIYH